MPVALEGRRSLPVTSQPFLPPPAAIATAPRPKSNRPGASFRTTFFPWIETWAVAPLLQDIGTRLSAKR